MGSFVIGFDCFLFRFQRVGSRISRQRLLLIHQWIGSVYFFFKSWRQFGQARNPIACCNSTPTNFSTISLSKKRRFDSRNLRQSSHAEPSWNFLPISRWRSTSTSLLKSFNLLNFDFFLGTPGSISFLLFWIIPRWRQIDILQDSYIFLQKKWVFKDFCRKTYFFEDSCRRRQSSKNLSHVVGVLKSYYLLKCAGGWLNQHCCVVATAIFHKSQ